MSQTGSNGAAELSGWTAIDSSRGLKPSQAPVIGVFVNGLVPLSSRPLATSMRGRPYSSSGYSSHKAWSSLLSMTATSTPTGMCSFPLNLAQYAMLSTHHHGQCGVSDELCPESSPRPRYGPRAASRHVNGGGERVNDVGRASSESGLRRRPSAQTVTWYVRPPPCSLAALSAIAVEGWKAFVPQPRSKFTRFPWT